MLALCVATKLDKRAFCAILFYMREEKMKIFAVVALSEDRRARGEPVHPSG
jgi:hypothetical protein